MPFNPPLISVVVPCYKMGLYIADALSSIGSQTYRNWEIIAVDDCGPDDGTREELKKFRDHFPSNRIEYIRLPENRGVSTARNAAVTASDGNLLAFLDPDDCWLPSHLELHLLAREGQPTIDVTGSHMKVLAEEGVEGWPEIWGYSPWEASCFPSTLALRCALNPSASVVSKECLQAIGGFDTEPAMQHVEDYDLWFRLAAAGACFKLIPEVTAVYRKHPAAATASSQRAVSQQRTQALAAKHYKQWLPSLAFSTYLLSERVGHLENRVKWLEKSLAFRVETCIRQIAKYSMQFLRKRK